ncbi:MAG: hypothetical protein AMXMBFR13_28740 [Phycisphaerae bacterium]
MTSRVFVVILLTFSLGALAGCSATSAVMTGGRVAWNLSKTDTHLRIWLDDHKAEQNTLKKAAVGYSEWKVDERVACGPKLRFEITKPEKLGRITMVAVSVFQQFEADYSHQAEYTLVAKDANDPQAQMKPEMVYNLASPGEDFKVIDLRGNPVEGIKLDPGKKYKLVLTVKADKSETAQIEFKTS